LVGWLLSMTFFAYCLLACLFLNIDEIEQLQKKKISEIIRFIYVTIIHICYLVCLVLR
jgi:hypothetical protein